MATLAPHRPAELTHWSDGRLGERDLAHIPGDGGLPLVGNTFRMLADPHGFTRRMVEQHGHVYRTKAFGGWQIAMIGADANELMLFDRNRNFSSEQGWGPILDKLFPRGRGRCGIIRAASIAASRGR